MATYISESLLGSSACGQLCHAVNMPLAQIEPPIACHCREARKQSSHYWCAFSVPRNDVKIESKAAVAEPAEVIAQVQLSPQARRGSCPRCYSFVFWQARATDTLDDKAADSGDDWSSELNISAGSRDHLPARWPLTGAIFTCRAGSPLRHRCNGPSIRCDMIRI